MTRARMPASLSTSTEIVAAREESCGWPDMGVDPLRMRTGEAGPRPSRRVEKSSDQHEALIGDRLCILFGADAEDHFVMRGAARDHRKAVFLRIDGDVGDDGG